MRFDCASVVVVVYASLAALLLGSCFVVEGSSEDWFIVLAHLLACGVFVLWYSINPIIIVYASRSLPCFQGWKRAVASSVLSLMLLVMIFPFYDNISGRLELVPELFSNRYGMFVEIASLVVCPAVVATLSIPFFIAGRWPALGAVHSTEGFSKRGDVP